MKNESLTVWLDDQTEILGDSTSVNHYTHPSGQVNFDVADQQVTQQSPWARLDG